MKLQELINSLQEILKEKDKDTNIYISSDLNDWYIGELEYSESILFIEG